MKELSSLYDRYNNKDFIEVTTSTQEKIITWLGGGKYNGKNVDVREICRKFSANGFIKFINEGVIIIKSQSPYKHTGAYPFKFTEDGTLIQSVLINNPETDRVELMCKVEVGIDTKWKVLDDTLNTKLGVAHMETEFLAFAYKMGVSVLSPVIKEVEADYPQLKPLSREWKDLVSDRYFNTIVKAQVLTTIGMNAYLVLQQKEILISKIEQKRIFHASKKAHKKSKRNPFYRYVVELPANYTPRKFDVNYVLSEWGRSGHMATRWVRKENASILAERKGGRVTDKTKGELVGIEIPINPQICHRNKEIAPHVGYKMYSQ